jgi:vacuolar-type H+-ATPase subunit I/STV1
LSKRVIALLLGVFALVLVAGCGSDDGEAGEETLTKVEFIKQGDEICEKTEEQSETEAEEFAEENGFNLENASEAELEEAVAEVLVPTLNQQIEEIDALGAPEGDEETIEELIAALEDGSAAVEDDPGIVFNGKPLKEASQIADEYGFEVCGE